MDPISVPGPPASAFNKHRRASDLIRKQVEHFKHLEDKLSYEDRVKLPRHAIVSEDDAARYIAAFTRFLMVRQTAPVQEKPIKIVSRRAKQGGLAIAAAAETAGSKTKKSNSRTKKPASANKRKR